MKAIRVREFGGPEVLRIEDLPDPEPGRGELLVRVLAAGVNPVDAYRRSGQYASLPKLPYTPGSDAAGVVEATGAGVERVKPGDRVFTAGTLSGAYAQKVLCREEQVHPLPDTVSYEQGASVWIPFGTAYRALFQRARAKAGETVLVHGASGGVGIACVQFARAAGLTVLGTAGTGPGRALVKEHGAAHVLDHTDPTHRDKILELTEGRGVDVIVEMLANVNLGDDLKILAHGGRVAVVGSRGRVEVDPRDAMQRETAVLGVMLAGACAPEKAEILRAIQEGLSQGTLRPVVGRRFPLAEAARAHEAIMASGALGKIVLIP